MRDRDLVTIDPQELRAAVRAAVKQLDLKTLVREAIDRSAEQSPEYRLDHEHRERMRARQVAVETAEAQVYPVSAGCPTGTARGAEMRYVEIFGVPTWLPCMPGAIRR